MQNFAEQCIDVARSVLSHNLNSINDDGSLNPYPGEISRLDEPGHVALAIGEFYRATGECSLDSFDMVDLVARTITRQAFTEAENGLAYASLGLLSFGPAKDRNIVWERLVDITRETLNRRLLTKGDYKNHWQAFNIAKSVARYSMGLSKKDETGRLIDQFLTRISETSSNKYFDDSASGLGGAFDIYGIVSFVTIRQALQLHANVGLLDRKLPSIRTYAEKYLRLIPDMVRQDGLGWVYGRGIGVYGQMHCISLILQALRDNWIPSDKIGLYQDILRRLFMYFYSTYLDQENGELVISDKERGTTHNHTTRMINFDAARYLSQWSRLARIVKTSESTVSIPSKTLGRFAIFDKSPKKEQGLFLYKDANSGLSYQMPLLCGTVTGSCDYLAFPHCPGIYDWPVNRYLPIMQPELTFGHQVTLPSFYGKKTSTGLGLRRSFFFKYEQPELINKDQEIVNGIGSCKVNWNFSGSTVSSDFTYKVKNQIQLDNFRYCLVIALPHSKHTTETSFKLGAESLRPTVTHDDFQAVWRDPVAVSQDQSFKTYYGKMHYILTLERVHPLVMRSGQQYRLQISFNPDISFAG